MAGLSERRLILAAGALLAGLGVVLGAFGAHGLKAMLDVERLGWWQTAVQYQMWHGLALVALAAAPVERVKLPAWLLGLGAIVFSVSLYLMALTGCRWPGAVAPLGGLAMIAGWAVLAWRAMRISR
ncbi:MAG: hypothetical protein QOH81_422 [Sphingomonadales bacterium]|nr:hypothetical protein [Sphingomonadales bacterium]